jgi:hypothetical protein
LPGLNVEVPPRPAERGDTPEIYSIVRLLGSIPFSPRDFPLQLAKTERPDFALDLSGRTIGIEHTEAVPRNAAHEASIRASQGRADPYFIRSATVDEPRKRRGELAAEISSNRLPPPMMGNSVEQAWAEAMAHFVWTKVASAKKPGYATYSEHWLAIYDNWPAAALQHHDALPFLKEQLRSDDPFAVFERILILDERILVELTHSGTLLHRVNHCQ